MAQPSTLEFASITQLYVSFFGRAPDSAGLTFWATALANGASLDTISEGFLLAPEGQEIYPATQTAEAFVEAFYQSTFGRVADAEGLAFWLNVLTAAGGVESAAARALLVGKINDVISAPLPDGEPSDSQAALDRALFANKVEYSLYVATQTDLTGPDAPAGNFSLTKITANPTSVIEQKAAADVAQDNGTPIGVTPPVSGGGGVVTPDQPLTFTKTYAELSAQGATVVGGTAFDTLAITTNQDIGGTPANVQNVEQIVLYTAAGTEVVSVDSARFVGAQAFVVRAEADVFLTGLKSGQSVQVNAMNADGDPISNGASNIAYAAGVTAGVVIVSQGITSGRVSVSGDALTSVALTSQGFALNKVSGLGLSDTVTSLSINALSGFAVGSGHLTGGAANNLAVVLTGAGRVDLGVGSAFLNGNIASLDASDNTGGVVARVSGQADKATTVLGSTSHDDFRLTGGTTFLAGSVVSLGAGNDYLGGGGASFASGVLVNGGDGLDSVSAYALNAGNAAAFTNFERVSVAGDQNGTAKAVDLDWVTGSTIQSLGLGGGDSKGGVTASNVQLSQSLNVTGNTLGGTTTLEFADAEGNNDAYTIKFNPSTPSSSALNASTVSVEGIEVLTLDSGTATGNTTEIVISDAALKTLNITGGFPIKVSFSTETTLTTTIDASAATGPLTLDTTNLVGDVIDGLTITGSAGANFLSIAQKATVTGGNAGDVFLLKPSLHLAGAEDDISEKLVSITNFGVGDQINVGPIAGGSTGMSLYKHGSFSAETLNEAAGVAIAAAADQATAAQEFAAFQFGGTTYVAADIDSDGVLGAGDIVVELVGQPNLNNVFVNVAQGTITNAFPIILPPALP